MTSLDITWLKLTNDDENSVYFMRRQGLQKIFINQGPRNAIFMILCKTYGSWGNYALKHYNEFQDA